MTHNSQGQVDPFDLEALVAASQNDGVKLTILVPTSVGGGQDQVALAQLREHTRSAQNELIETGLKEADAKAMLKPLYELLDDSVFFSHLSRGLAVFAGQDFFQAVRVPLELPSMRSVGEDFNLVPLTPMLEQDGRVYILAISQNKVRLFDSSRNHIQELPLGSIPEDLDSTVSEIPEQTLTYRSAGGQRTGFYGTGGTSDVENHYVENFLRRVGEGVAKELGTARSQPLVVASVSEYLTPFKSNCPYPAVQDSVIPGNPEHTSAEELRSQAWQLLRKQLADAETKLIDKARSHIANGQGSYDLAEVNHAASQARVDTLFLPGERERLHQVAENPEASQAMFSTLATKGRIRTVVEFPDKSDAVATFRY